MDDDRFGHRFEPFFEGRFLWLFPMTVESPLPIFFVAFLVAAAIIIYRCLH